MQDLANARAHAAHKRFPRQCRRLPFTVVITKADKLSKAQLGNAKLRIAAALGLARDDLIVTSSSKNIGRDALLDRLQNVLEVFGSDAENGDAPNDDEQ